MTTLITGVEIRTCFGESEATFEALAEGRSGAGELRHVDSGRLGVNRGYHVEDAPDEALLRASEWLSDCVASAVAQSGIDVMRARVAVVVGTGLRELRAVERLDEPGITLRTAQLHFTEAVRQVLPDATEVITVCNACSASGHALALACDMLDLDEADAVVAAGCDAMTESMLAMIGRVSDEPTDQLRPFDDERMGVLLGEGAAAVVLERGDRPRTGRGPVLGKVLGVGLSCDAFHETAPQPEGIARAMHDAHERAAVTPGDVDLVVAHATGTALNDPTEAGVLSEVFAAAAPGPVVTGIKGSTGHTSGSAALMSVAVALRALAGRPVPAITGLRRPLPEAEPLRLVIGAPATVPVRVAQVNAFGFGGVNAVCMIGGAS
ncbi:beta-ketoacyl synthase N-terminal-like domain-containing protein [Streptomyces aureus]|uniref:beta-ketoacyl synthase N-terminal-like domain-containing protein n=1 Tax=Streptomyces aureus TaxID=193461 RepID=UPI0033C55AED